jgi:hypothetical protein
MRARAAAMSARRGGAGWLHVLAVALDQVPGAQKIMSNLDEALILRARPRPLAGRAATDTVPQPVQPHHQIRPRRRTRRYGWEDPP